MYASAWSLLPFLIVIPVSMWTRQVLPGLMVGLLVGAYMVQPSLFGGIDTTLHYLIKELEAPDNLSLALFLYGFGAFVGLVRVTGGVAGFGALMERRIKTVRGAFIVTWLSSIATFMAPDFRIITVAPVMRNVFARLCVPTEEVALTIDITSTPLCALIPIATAFVGYMVGLIAVSAKHHGLAQSAYHLFLLSLPFNFFSFLMLGYGAYRAFAHSGQEKGAARNVQPDAAPSRGTPPSRGMPISQRYSPKLRLADAETAKEIAPDANFPDAVELVAGTAKPRSVHLLIPLFLLIVLSLFLTWWDGHFGAANFLQALAHANAAKAMLEAVLITLLASFVLYTVSRQPLKTTMFGLLSGGNEMMAVIVLLVLVWAVSAVSTDLGLIVYIERTLGHVIPRAFLAPALFLFGCAISYVIGSSFGTWGMLLPLGVTLAVGTHASLPLVLGAVFASGTFGGFASPLSDNTVAMATVLKLPVMEYARTKLKTSLPIVGVCTACYAAAGFFLP